MLVVRIDTCAQSRLTCGQAEVGGSRLFHIVADSHDMIFPFSLALSMACGVSWPPRCAGKSRSASATSNHSRAHDEDNTPGTFRGGLALCRFGHFSNPSHPVNLAHPTANFSHYIPQLLRHVRQLLPVVRRRGGCVPGGRCCVGKHGGRVGRGGGLVGRIGGRVRQQGGRDRRVARPVGRCRCRVERLRCCVGRRVPNPDLLKSASFMDESVQFLDSGAEQARCLIIVASDVSPICFLSGSMREK